MTKLESTFKDINYKFMKQTDSLIKFKNSNNSNMIREETEYSLPISPKNNNNEESN